MRPAVIAAWFLRRSRSTLSNWRSSAAWSAQGVLVIACGGGGIPVVWKDGSLQGVEAVIDKDRASAWLAARLGVDLFVISTDTDYVYLDYKKPTQRPLQHVSAAELEEYAQRRPVPARKHGSQNRIRVALSARRRKGSYHYFLRESVPGACRIGWHTLFPDRDARTRLSRSLISQEKPQLPVGRTLMPKPNVIPLQPPASPSSTTIGTARLKHVIESQQFTVPLLMELFERSRGMERIVARGGTLDYQNRIMTTLFYAPSTRTRLSFEAAMHRLGGRVLSTENAGAFSSEIEGEQVEDSIRIISGYSDVIVIRHTAEDGARRAAEVSLAPVINAGDGNGGQHPTQALLDLYTIYRQRPLNGLSVAIIGELDRGRTARSLAYLLAKFERVKMFFVSPPQLQMKPDILEYLDEHGVRYELESDIERVIGEVDVVYQTRIRPERVRDVAGESGRATVNRRPPALCHRFDSRAAHEARRADPASAAADG